MKNLKVNQKTVIISSKHRKINSKHIHNLAILIQINANSNLHSRSRTINQQRVGREISRPHGFTIRDYYDIAKYKFIK